MKPDQISATITTMEGEKLDFVGTILSCPRVPNEPDATYRERVHSQALEGAQLPVRVGEAVRMLKGIQRELAQFEVIVDPYIQSKRIARDWHGIADAANDLRDMEAGLAVATVVLAILEP